MPLSPLHEDEDECALSFFGWAKCTIRSVCAMLVSQPLPPAPRAWACSRPRDDRSPPQVLWFGSFSLRPFSGCGLAVGTTRVLVCATLTALRVRWLPHADRRLKQEALVEELDARLARQAEATRELERHRDELAAQLASARVSEQRASRRLAALEEERRRLLLASPREVRRQAIFLEAASVAIRAARR